MIEKRIVLVDGYEVTSYSYDAIGNLLSKSDYASEYDYINGSTGGPNAVKRVYRNGWKSIGYDARGNMTSGDGLTSAIYNAMDKPTQIKKAGKTLDFTYGPQHMRFKQVNGSVTTFYSDKLYEEEVNGSKTTWRAYVDDIAVISQTTSESAAIRYTHKDRLGSARIFTDKNGYVTAQRNFDPFGKPRLASGSLMPYGNSKLNDLADAKTSRGFTDHEHLDDVELIHMNGRVYDYNLGRFMSVDPVIQSPTNSQSINPYSYIMNNPLAGTDPTGYTGCAASRIESTCESLGSSFGGYDTNYGAEAQAYGDASLAVANPTASVGKNISNGLDQSLASASSKLDSMDIGSRENVANDGTNQGQSYSSTITGSIEPIVGSSTKGFLKSLVNGITAGIVYGDISRFPSLNADPIDSADIEAYEEQAGASRYAMVVLPGKIATTATQTLRSLPMQIHHFATNKSKLFTPAMEKIAEKYGLKLDEMWNKQSLPHLGRHPNVYHQFVLDGMRRSHQEARGNVDTFLSGFDKYVKQPVLNNPELLRKSGWE